MNKEIQHFLHHHIKKESTEFSPFILKTLEQLFEIAFKELARKKGKKLKSLSIDDRSFLFSIRNFIVKTLSKDFEAKMIENPLDGLSFKKSNSDSKMRQLTKKDSLKSLLAKSKEKISNVLKSPLNDLISKIQRLRQNNLESILSKIKAIEARRDQAALTESFFATNPSLDPHIIVCL